VVIPTVHYHYGPYWGGMYPLYSISGGLSSGGLFQQALSNLQQQAIPMNALGDEAEHTH